MTAINKQRPVYDLTRFEGSPADGLYRMFTVAEDGAEERTGVVIQARSLVDAYAAWHSVQGSREAVFRTERESTYDRLGPTA